MSDDVSPIYEGLDPSWNDVVSAFPEDKRSEYAGFIKTQMDSYAPLKQWEEFAKSGITPEQASTAVGVYNTIENNPKRVYEALGAHLGITPQQAQEVVEELEDADPEEDPRIATLQKQLATVQQILVARHQEETQSRLEQQAEAEIDREIAALKKKYNDVDEDILAVFMANGQMSAEQAYKAYTERDARIRATRPSPMLLGGGGQVPNRAIDPTKLSSSETKNLVAQMMQQAAQSARD